MALRGTNGQFKSIHSVPELSDLSDVNRVLMSMRGGSRGRTQVRPAQPIPVASVRAIYGQLVTRWQDLNTEGSIEAMEGASDVMTMIDLHAVGGVIEQHKIGYCAGQIIKTERIASLGHRRSGVHAFLNGLFSLGTRSIIETAFNVARRMDD